VRDGSKAAMILALIRRPEGATIHEIADGTKWQEHSIRGFISGTLAKKMGLKIETQRRRTAGVRIALASSRDARAAGVGRYARSLVLPPCLRNACEFEISLAPVSSSS